MSTSNFAMLQKIAPELAKLGAQAEAHYFKDPTACIGKGRTFCEQLILWLYREHKLNPYAGASGDALKSLSARIQELFNEGVIKNIQAGRFHEVRKLGNPAVHENKGDIFDADKVLRHCHALAVWFVEEYFDGSYQTYFVAPKPPKDPAKELAEVIALLEAAAQQREKDAAARAAYEAQIAALAAKLDEPDIALHEALNRACEAIPVSKRASIADKIKALRADGVLGKIQPFSAADIDPKFGWISLVEPYVLVVVRSPDQADVLFVWIDTLGGAEAWAKVNRFEVNPVLGSLQHYTVPSAQVSAKKGRLFAALSDADLALCAVPHVLAPAVRALKDADGFAALLPHLPLEAGAALSWVAQGEPLQAALALAAVGGPQQSVNTQDFSAALAHETSRQHFVPLNDDATLDAIFQAPLQQWRVFLHPDQRKVVRAHANGPMRVMGGAGTGKTVALLHRAVYLLREVFTSPTDRLLITTFTRNLAADLRALVDDLLQPEERRRVDVTNLHQWMQSVLKETQLKVHVVSAVDQKSLMKLAIKETPGANAFADSLYHDEWSLVVQAHPIATQAAYLTARREGRGTALNRRQRQLVWRVLERYRALLDERKRIDWFDLARLTRAQLAQGVGPRYRAVLVDEVQDFKAEELRLIRSILPEGPNDLFLVGDNHQRIFSAAFPFAACGIQIRGRSHRLTLNYRTTERICRHAVRVLASHAFDDQDEGQDHLSGYRALRLGVEPVYHLCVTWDEEKRWVVQQVRSWLEACEPEGVCVAAPTRHACSAYLRALLDAGIGAVEITDYIPKVEGVRVATIHRLKGTEFKRLILAGVQSGSLPATHKHQDFADAASEDDHERGQRSLFYVAATRARDLLYISGYGEPSPFLTPNYKASLLEPAQVGALLGLFGSLPQGIVGVLKHLLGEMPMSVGSLEAQLEDYVGKMGAMQPPLALGVREEAMALVEEARVVLGALRRKETTQAAHMLGQVAVRYLVLQDDAAPDFASPGGLEDDRQVLAVAREALLSGG